MTQLVIFVIGLLCGVVGTLLVIRNNKAKASSGIGKL
jgi:ribose/xylose/arabinose/galactoside ABC-type transport system permease subunit